MKKTLLKGLALAVVGTALAAGSAMAVPTLKLYDGTTTKIIADGGLTDSNPVAGAVTFVGAIGNWSINVSTGITKPAQGSAAVPFMDLNSINTTNRNGGNLKVWFSEVGFGPLGPALIGFTTAYGGTTEGTITVKSYVDESNALFGTATEIADSGLMSGGAFSGSKIYSHNPSTSPFSMTIFTDVTHVGAHTTSYDVSVAANPVPEPATMLLLGTGLVGLAGGARRRMKKKEKE